MTSQARAYSQSLQHKMEGEIGVLYQDKQIGGVYNWTIHVAYDSTVKNDWVETTSKRAVSAQAYWLIEKPEGNIFDIELYKVVNNQLVLMQGGTVEINLPDTETLDRKLWAPVEIKDVE